jgi:hypothetical protein
MLVSGLFLAPGQVAADDHSLDLVGALEDLHDRGPWGSSSRSAPCMIPWCQHGFSTGFVVLDLEQEVLGLVEVVSERLLALPARPPALRAVVDDPRVRAVVPAGAVAALVSRN